MKLDESARYAPSHEWIRAEGAEALVGISDYAQEALGDIVFVELPALGKRFEAGQAFCVVESVKAASDVYMPVTATVTAVNPALAADPGLVNRDCYGGGWLVRVKPEDPAALNALQDSVAYAAGLPERH